MLNVYRVAEWVLRTVLTLNWAFHDQFGINVITVNYILKY
jgi:hypothetical protein